MAGKRQYTVREGYTFLHRGQHYRHPEVLTLSDEEIADQKWKVEPKSTKAAKEEEPEVENAAVTQGGRVRNRAIQEGQTKTK